MERLALVASGVLGFLAVALGAFGAHGLKSRLGPLADGAARLEWWSTGAHYHLAHAVALAAVGYLAGRSGASTAVVVAAGAFVVGILLFSGSLYAMALTGTRALGMITPLGGLGFLVGWAAVALAAWSLPASPKP
ncbi:MAG: DUF423 domain-containing protein [Labilithrix sp.]|nr:DUF423 domain-containing protein [Labilithrix sp.]